MKPQILSYSVDEYIEKITAFHGYPAPGVIIGGFMVDLAVRNLPEGILYDAIAETRTCLPDAVQLLTPCTFGNGWLTVLPLGRFAISLYDKKNENGVRVFLDAEKKESWQEVRNWFLKLKTKQEQDSEKLFKEIRNAGQDILGLRHVHLQPDFTRRSTRGKLPSVFNAGKPIPSKMAISASAARDRLLIFNDKEI